MCVSLCVSLSLYFCSQACRHRYKNILARLCACVWTGECVRACLREDIGQLRYTQTAAPTYVTQLSYVSYPFIVTLTYPHIYQSC